MFLSDKVSNGRGRVTIAAQGHFTLYPRAVNMKLWGPSEGPTTMEFEIDFCVVTGLQVLCEDIPDQALRRMLFHHHLIHVGPSKLQ